MARSKDPLTAAMTTYWVPVLREYGFQKYTNRSFARITDDCVFQYIDVQSHSHGDKRFLINYACLLITRLHEHVGSDTFWRLNNEKAKSYGWWEANTHESADESMQVVCAQTRNIAMPWFQSTSTALGLARELEILKGPNKSHNFFELGCCYATAGELTAATVNLQEAVRRFQSCHDDFQKTYLHLSPLTWALLERSLADELLRAVQDGTYSSVLSRWKEQTVVNLKLSKLEGRLKR
jgi:hypothetical protein